MKKLKLEQFELRFGVKGEILYFLPLKVGLDSLIKIYNTRADSSDRICDWVSEIIISYNLVSFTCPKCLTPYDAIDTLNEKLEQIVPLLEDFTKEMKSVTRN
jgi:hypothetical protein